MLPLVEEVWSSSASASEETAVEQEVGKELGRSVKLLVHHTRNTAAKQWEETLALALGGLGKVMRAHLVRLKEMGDFGKLWSAMLMVGWAGLGGAA